MSIFSSGNGAASLPPEGGQSPAIAYCEKLAGGTASVSAVGCNRPPNLVNKGISCPREFHQELPGASLRL